MSGTKLQKQARRENWQLAQLKGMYYTLGYIAQNYNPTVDSFIINARINIRKLALNIKAIQHQRNPKVKVELDW